ncbi:putative disease resistance protein RGA3 isoform X2 [Papaver somniferum]|uniref:putative disease resistance protein RGA3 isoform X2 n=1 Tax=Papaver somniferum TaxID=3469 RepID=UPI000E6F6C70|nr:putative disease resistance protein RGA3 isoform X2 [Papaver somniferum]
MGGIGKTALAKLVFHIADDDNSLEDPFVIKKWVSMYGKSSNKEIFCDILESNADRQSSLNVIQEHLKERLKVGKCLIVLDDVWKNQGIDVEELLKDLLSLSCPGSKILMTMRSAEDIPPMTYCRYKIYQLQVLPEDDCWSMIKKIAFGHGGATETTNLINIGKQIASRCGGLPLAAKVLGGLLYSRKSEKEWLDIKIWNLPQNENKIIPILKLSYDHLSPEVKRCFSYCSLFPKGHRFVKKELIRMWMAESFLNSRPEPNASQETIGNEYFKILLLNSFIQDEYAQYKKHWDWKDSKTFIMHDLVHDLVMSVAGSESRMVEVNTDADPEVIEQYDKSRRLGLHYVGEKVSAIPSEIYKASKLRTFVVSHHQKDDDFNYYNLKLNQQIFSFNLLRVLSLNHTDIKKLPESIGELRHLRASGRHDKADRFGIFFIQFYKPRGPCVY